MNNKASKLVSAAIIGLDNATILVNSVAYTVMPPTIERLAGASYYLSDVQDCSSLADIITQMKDINNASIALAWFVCDEKETKEQMIEEVKRLAPVLAKGTIDEVVEGLTVAYSLVGIENFKKLSTLARNVGMLTARQRPQETHVS